MVLVRWLMLLLLMGLAMPAARGAPTQQSPVHPLSLPDLDAPTFTNFSPRDGLPDTVTVAVRADREGFVWAASPAGVFRYDGRHWVASDDPAMAHSADSLGVDSEGTLWAAFRNDGLARYDGAHWHVEDAGTGLPSQRVRRFAETVDGQGAHTLWATTWDHGLMFRRDGRWQEDPDNDTLPHGAVLAMAQTSRLGAPRREWVGTGDAGLWYRDTGTRGWRQWHDAALDSAQVEFLLTVVRHGREELWMSVFGVGLFRLDDDGLRHWGKEPGGLPTLDIYDIADTPMPDGDRAVWVASRSGLLRVHDDHVQVFDRRYGLRSDVVRGLDAWRSPGGHDVLWLATESGVSRTVAGVSPWSTASLMGSRSTGVFGVLVEPDGRGGERLWVGSSEDGLGLFEDGRWRQFTAGDGALPAPSVSMITATTAADGVRTRWLGLRGGGLLRIGEGPVFEPVDTPWAKASGEAVLDTLAWTRDGREEQWFATRQSGLYLWRDGRWSAIHVDGVSGQWRVARLRAQTDRHGHRWLWASTNRGLLRFDGKDWTLLGRDAGLPDSELLDMQLVEEAGGRAVLWLGTTNAGITRVDASDPRHPVVLPPTLPRAPDPTVYSAQIAPDGRVYVCTNNGVQLLTPEGNGSYRSRVFTRADGLVSDECNLDAQVIDAHGRYWTGTLGGLAVYDPARNTHDTHAKPLRITALRVDGRPVAGPVLRMPVGTKEVEVDFALLSWYREEDSRFRTQLIGYEQTPGTWTAQASRNFSALPPGEYRLRIEARDHAGNPARPVDVPIVVETPWWQQPLARIGAVMALLLLASGVFLWRTRSLRAQRRALERRVAARTAELNDANARLLDLSYRDALTGLPNRRRLLERLELAASAKAPRTSTAIIFIDVDYFKTFNDRFGHPDGDEALRAVAAALRRCAPEGVLVARYGGEEFACLLAETDAAYATAWAERLRADVASLGIRVTGSDEMQRITISAGVASRVLAGAEDALHLLREADIALYQAKREGRDRVCAWRNGLGER